MPIIKSAKKKMRQDKKRRIANLETLAQLKRALTKARKNPLVENIRLASAIIDRAAKKKIIHKNKAARLKARLGKRAIIKKPSKRAIKTVKK